MAGANTGIWTDIYLSNRDALMEGIDDLLERLQSVRGWLARATAPSTRRMERARRGASASWCSGQGSSAGRCRSCAPRCPNRPGVIAEIALALGRDGVNIADMALSPSVDNRQGVIALWIRGEEHLAARAGADRRARVPGRAGVSPPARATAAGSELADHDMNMRFEPSGGLSGAILAPADKSISHRAALLGAMSSEPVRIERYLHAADTRSTLEAVRALGALVEDQRRPDAVVIRGTGLREAREPDGPIDVGNAGTLLRMLPGLAGRPGRALVHARRRRLDPPPPGGPHRRPAGARWAPSCEARERRYPPLHVQRRAPARDLLRARRSPAHR